MRSLGIFALQGGEVQGIHAWQFFRRLLLINATLAGSLFLIMAVFRYGNLVKTSAALVILYSLPFLLFLVSIVVSPDHHLAFCQNG
jgi:hypothetical protein